MRVGWGRANRRSRPHTRSREIEILAVLPQRHLVRRLAVILVGVRAGDGRDHDAFGLAAAPGEPEGTTDGDAGDPLTPGKGDPLRAWVK